MDYRHRLVGSAQRRVNLRSPGLARPLLESAKLRYRVVLPINVMEANSHLLSHHCGQQPGGKFGGLFAAQGLEPHESHQTPPRSGVNSVLSELISHGAE